MKDGVRSRALRRAPAWLRGIVVGEPAGGAGGARREVEAAEARLLAEAAEVLDRAPPASEADKNVFRVALASVEARLSAFDAEHPGRLAVLQALARLADKQGHMPDSVARWRRVRTLALPAVDEANFRLGNAYRRLAELDEAQACLAAVSPEWRDQEVLAEERSRLAKRISIEASIKHAESAARAPAPEKAEKSLEHIAKSLSKARLHGKNPAVLALLQDAYEVIARSPLPPAASTQPEAGPDAHDGLANYRRLRIASTVPSRRPSVVFTSGFLWSGSGVVTDMLRGMQDVCIGAMGRELSLFQRKHGLLGLFNAPAGAIGRRELMRLLLGPVAGLLVGRAAVTQERDRSLLKACADAGGPVDELIRSCRGLLAAIDALPADGDARDHALLSALRDFANAAADGMRVRPAASVVLNNNIFGFNVRMLALFSDAMCIAVKRDPRDQYVAHYYERKRADVMPIDVFIERTRARYDEHDATVASLGLSDRVLTVRFEDFVLEPATRAEVLERLRLDPSAASATGATGTFDPAASARNIGIHKGFPHQADIRRIEAAFPDLLYAP